MSCGAITTALDREGHDGRTEPFRDHLELRHPGSMGSEDLSSCLTRLAGARTAGPCDGTKIGRSAAPHGLKSGSMDIPADRGQSS